MVNTPGHRVCNETACSPRPQFNKMATNLVNCTQYQIKKLNPMKVDSHKIKILNYAAEKIIYIKSQKLV